MTLHVMTSSIAKALINKCETVQGPISICTWVDWGNKEEVVEEEEKKKNLTIKIDCFVIQINHSINITVLMDVKVCSLENK